MGGIRLRDMHWTSAAARPGAVEQDRGAPAQEIVWKRDTDASDPDTWSSVEPVTLVFADPASQSLAKLLGRIAPSDIPVMIRGDSGTGKGAIARYLHRLSGRSGPLVHVDCNVIANGVPEARARAGNVSGGATAPTVCEEWLESARHGTLFLDEVGALPSASQGQLLRALQGQEAAGARAHPSGPADVRLVAATTVDLDKVVSAGHFRLELLYRLNVGQVRLLPLRQRCGDVAALAAHFLRIYAARLNLPPPLLSPESMAARNGYSWPGNVRELENVIRFALLGTSRKDIQADQLRLADVSSAERVLETLPEAAIGAVTHSGEPAATPLRQLLTPLFQTPGACLLKDLESQIIAEAFHFTGRNQVRTAELLGISRNVLRTLLRKHGVFLARRRGMRQCAG
jgi:DNA-binding NtrC family response regulator